MFFIRPHTGRVRYRGEFGLSRVGEQYVTVQFLGLMTWSFLLLYFEN
jgi:hypothetical protein